MFLSNYNRRILQKGNKNNVESDDEARRSNIGLTLTWAIDQ